MADISNLLSSIGATLDSHDNVDFNAGTHTSEYMTLINHRGLLSICGVDSKKFLQGQLTCDIDLLTDQQAITGASCSPKGRVIGNFTLSQWDDQQLCFSGHRGSMSALHNHLNKYIVFSKADLNLIDNYVCLGIKTDNITAATGLLFDQVPVNNLTQSHHNDRKLLLIDAAQGLFEVWLPRDQLATSWQQLSSTLSPTNSSDWDRDIIASGFANTDQNTSDLFIPQHLNMQLNGGISFTKGCYTGQEVVARMQYRGKLKRHMYRVTATTLPPSGSPLYDGQGEQSIGNMVQTAHDGEKMVGLAVLADKSVAANSVFCDQAGELPLTELSLPYSITAE
ncbi:tRNA-modifying protein YgfZ [Sinobacterium norvegicum]|uniref:tRNA-modifying protein YgfZ n=1 Tax=Sinobacterium norvegicum TaxID=1641715 RepID=A0ABN8ED83_9GAMM|nr:hypothetical protein [Sinobacterium norvegicum]CAH0990425.1 tRNA-modifying protein YgfZ [Sinobacterium norvegicum]